MWLWGDGFAVGHVDGARGADVDEGEVVGVCEVEAVLGCVFGVCVVDADVGEVVADAAAASTFPGSMLSSLREPKATWTVRDS